MDRLAKGILFFLLMFCLGGCPALIGAGMGVGTYYLVQGDLAQLYRTSYARAWEAAMTTLEEMEMTIVRETKEETEGKIEAKRFDGSPVRVMIAQKALDLTELRVRIGAVGDRAKAEIFHERFRDNVFD
jgi:hypothetical protein